MVEPVVTVALETIRDLLLEEGKFLLGVRDQVEEVRAELEALQSFLQDANARKHEEESLRTWVRQAKRLAYRAEDAIEEYAIKVASKRGGGFRKGARRAIGILGEGTSIHKVGNEIGNIKTEIANLIRRLEGYGINRVFEAQPSSAKIEKQRRQRTTYAHQVDEYFVGMEDDVSKLVTWVTEDDKIRRVISVCGIGGLGKTTIARKVFNHRQVQRSFECFAWVSVTQQCQVMMLLQSILTQILGDKSRDKAKDLKEEELVPMLYEGRDNVKDLKEVELVPKLYDVLKNKKCFIVLDDIWNLDDWDSLRPAFPISEGSTTILLTTRTRDVATVAHRESQHEPTLLDEKDGWDLLTKIALDLQEDHQGNKLPETVEIVGRDILRKCGGLPLAIASLGGILKNKEPSTEWEMVNKNFEKYNSGIRGVLAFSYDDLPSHLRPCFLYMGCFHEDEDIDVMRLYQLWMAEGLVPASKKGPEETLLDAGSDILDELISRNLVQPQVRDVLTDKSCRLHDLVRELCLTKGKEEQFLEVKSKPNENGEAGPDLCRQAILINGRVWGKNGIEISRNATYFRALIINISLGRDMEMPRLNFKRLRSLILDNCNFKDNKLPSEIRDMIHLRYLSLQQSLYLKLPAFIGDLQYIQTLDLRNNQWLLLPNIFYKMKRLRCLYLPKYRRRSTFSKRLEFHGLNELEVLEGFDGLYDQCTHLSELVNLRRFGASITDYEELSTILVPLSSLLKIEYIYITIGSWPSTSYLQKSCPDARKLLLCPSLHNLELYAPIEKFPRYEPQFWPDLVSLKLYFTEFEEDPMSFLQELPNLRELVLWHDAYVGEEMYCSSKAFPKLTFLTIGSLPNIEKWRVDAGAFPNLQTLKIKFCKSFEIVPHGLTRITTLTRLDIWNMPEEFEIKYGKEAA